MVETTLMPKFLLSKLTFGHEANRVVVLVTTCRLLKTSVESLIENGFELTFDIQDRLPESRVTMPFPAFLVWCSDELHRRLTTFFAFLLVRIRLYGNVRILDTVLALTTRRDKRFRSDHDFFLKLFIELDLFISQALHLILVQLVPFEMLAD